MQELARRATFARLVRDEAPAAHGVAWRLVGNASEAEDLVQEAFLRAWRHLERLAPGAAVRPWFYRILINAGRDRLRRRSVRRHQPEPPVRPEGDPGIHVARRELLERVQVEVEKLPLRQRECLLLRTRAHLSYSEMAELLGIKVGVVKNHLVKARRRLLALFGAEMKEWGGER